ncbi:MAG: YggU family protein [Thermoplasmata archaeon]|nr:MAG: YggU family protein [Thermoplasmata archaeon]
MTDLYRILSGCMKQKDDGVLIEIEVIPSAGKYGIQGIDEWRGRIRIGVNARAEKGMANRELIRLLSSMFALTTSEVIIVKGNRSRNKSLLVKGIPMKEIATKIKQEMGRNEHMNRK